MLRQALDRHLAGSAGTRSALEQRYLALVAPYVPAPQVNVRVLIMGKRLELDCYWADYWLGVEVDGGAHARRRSAREDADRDILINHAGLRYLRILEWEIEHEPDAVIERTCRALEAGARDGRLRNGKLAPPIVPRRWR